MTDIQEIFNAVKNDDEELFSLRMQEKKSNLSLCYGRFPLLSLCYLYNAVKIIRRYEKDLDGVSPYTIVAEPYEAYVKFRAYAKRALRLYAPAGKKTVPPVEMLAITGASEYLSEVYPHLNKGANTEGNIRHIYKTAHGENILINGEGVLIAGVRMSKLNKIFILIAVIVAAIMAAVPFGVWNGLKNYFGEGTAENPTRIYNAAQLEAALEADKPNIILMSDLTLSASFAVSEYSGKVNGNGKTLRVSAYKKGLIETLTGTVERLNVVFTATDAVISEDAALVVFTNKGALRGLRVSFSGSFLSVGTDGVSLKASALVSVNNGEISTCSAFVEITINGVPTADTLFSAMASSNNGTISGCSLEDGSVIDSVDADLAGIAAYNNANGVIRNCTAAGKISQTSASVGWSPFVAGIAYQNNGEISTSENRAEITAESSAAMSYDSEAETSDLAIARAAGIAISNAGEIIGAINTGVITARSSATASAVFAYAGGVVVTNTGSLSACVNNATGAISALTASLTNSPELLAGGIAAASSGKINGALNSAEITVYTQGDGMWGAVYAGGIAASSDGAVDKGKNEGNLNVTVGVAQAFIGGIVGLAVRTNNSVATGSLQITRSCSYGSINLSSPGDGALLLAGGIVGLISGEISDSYSAMEFSTDSTKSYIGGVIGGAYTFYLYNVSNNYYIERSNVPHGIGSVLIMGGNLGDPGDNGVTKVADIDGLKALDIYWG
ncbi:MAG: hypothetical protein LBT55_03265 [Clostridiaceae bacterium]|jgi:hypothetical protein|nr:hypothetical protein [Clostridiaceae bacterium]